MNMDGQMADPRVFETLAACVALVLPDIAAGRLGPEDSLKELGANSIERAEIILEAAERLSVRVPMTRFAQCRNLGEIAIVLGGG